MSFGTTLEWSAGQNENPHQQQGIVAVKQNEEKPVNCKQAREILGWGSSYMSAVRRAMGISSRYFFLSDVRRFIRNNPTFTSSQIYHFSACKCEKCALKPSKSETMNDKSKQTSKMQSSVANVPPPTEVSKPIPLNYGQLFGEKFRTLRGNLSVAALSAKADLSRETLRQAEAGIHASLKTVESLRLATAMDETDWLELLLLWIKMQLCNEAWKFRFEIIAPYTKSTNGEHSQAVELITDYFRALNPTHQRFMVKLMSSRERIAALCVLANYQETRPAPPGENSTAGTEIVADTAEEPHDGLWTSL